MSYLQEEVFKDIRNMSVAFVEKNYDYCFLTAMHQKIVEEGAEVLIVGCSHSMNGIINSEMRRKTVNLSVSSQDLYYCAKQIEKALDHCRPRYCLINLGLWGLYQNLAKQKHQGMLVDVLFNPLVHDSHGKELVEIEEWKYDNAYFHKLEKIYDKATLKKMAEDWGVRLLKEESSYYNSILTRESNSKMYKQGRIWWELSESERDEEAIERTDRHNALYKYAEARVENELVLSQLLNKLKENNVIPIVVIFPQTKEYRKHIDKRYKEEIVSFLDGLDQEVFFWDMSDEPVFEDSDFVDSDHMSTKGAAKATKLVSDYLDLVEELKCDNAVDK